MLKLARSIFYTIIATGLTNCAHQHGSAKSEMMTGRSNSLEARKREISSHYAHEKELAKIYGTYVPLAHAVEESAALKAVEEAYYSGGGGSYSGRGGYSSGRGGYSSGGGGSSTGCCSIQ